MNVGEQQAALDRARQGDAAARGVLLDSFRPYVRVITRALRGQRIRGRLDDSDLIQDALLEAHRCFSNFQGTSIAEWVAWLRQVVIRSVGHSLRSHLDAGKRAVSREQADGDLAALLDSGSSPSAQAIRHEQAARMAQAMALLPHEMQEVLLGRLVNGLSHAVIAHQLGRSEVSVRVMYSRAVQRLRDECRGM